MKKIVTIALFSVYLLLQIGITTHVHMCHNQVSDIQLFDDSKITCELHANSHCCSVQKQETNCCESQSSCMAPHTESHETCCVNTTVLLQYINNTQYVSQKPSIQLYPIHIAKQTLITTEYTSEELHSTSFMEYTAPPPEDLVSLYCSYIFYG